VCESIRLGIRYRNGYSNVRVVMPELVNNWPGVDFIMAKYGQKGMDNIDTGYQSLLKKTLGYLLTTRFDFLHRQRFAKRKKLATKFCFFHPEKRG